MVKVETQTGPERRTFLLAKSNLSMTLDRLAAVYLGLCAVTLLVALWPTIMGLWPIMPVAVLHLLIVGWCLRRAWRGNWVRERILIGPDIVRIEHAALVGNNRRELPTAWLKVIRKPAAAGEFRVFLGNHSERIEVGAFLPSAERGELARALEAGLRPFSAWNNRKSSASG